MSPLARKHRPKAETDASFWVLKIRNASAIICFAITCFANFSGVSLSANSVLRSFIHDQFQDAQGTRSIDELKRVVTLPHPFQDASDTILNKSERSLTVREHFFWKGRQAKLCNLITDTKYGNYSLPNGGSGQVILSLRTNCNTISNRLGIGTGNIVTGYYAMRLAAAVSGLDFYFRCTDAKYASTYGMDADGRPWTHVLHYLQGYFAAPATVEARRQFSPFYPPLPSFEDACRGMGHCPLQYMINRIKEDMQRMADRVMKQQQHTTLDLDDVAIHFRCGDILRGINDDAYGILKFSTYIELIPLDTKSIGIVTAPFNASQMRERDRAVLGECELITRTLENYLTKNFPRTTVSIRNDNEGFPLVYTRLIRANLVISSTSTFSLFPLLASSESVYTTAIGVNYPVLPLATVVDNLNVLSKNQLLTSKMIRRIDMNAKKQNSNPVLEIIQRLLGPDVPIVKYVSIVALRHYRDWFDRNYRAWLDQD